MPPRPTARSVLFATAAAVALLGAGTVPAQAQAPAAGVTDQGVLVFTPDFFAAQQPNTALDMVERIPGFSVEDGDGSRGFEGAVGNVLVNGARPASKNDRGSAVLSRTLARQVERIELVRGGAPGIDMQGYAVVVNVILKDEASREHVVEVTPYLFEGDGTNMVSARYQFTARDGDRSWGLTLSDGADVDDSNGGGISVRRDAAGQVLRRERFREDEYGGGASVRGNYAGPLLGGRIDLTARLGVNDYHEESELTGDDVRRLSRFDWEGESGEIGAVYTRPLRAGLTSETRFIHEFGTSESVAVSSSRLCQSPRLRSITAAANSPAKSTMSVQSAAIISAGAKKGGDEPRRIARKLVAKPSGTIGTTRPMEAKPSVRCRSKRRQRTSAACTANSAIHATITSPWRCTQKGSSPRLRA